MKSIVHLKPGECRWPVATDANGTHLFCCVQKRPGKSPYCERHHKLAYEPPIFVKLYDKGLPDAVLARITGEYAKPRDAAWHEVIE